MTTKNVTAGSSRKALLQTQNFQFIKPIVEWLWELLNVLC